MKKLITFLLITIILAFSLTILTGRSATLERALNRWLGNFGYSGYYSTEQCADLLIDSDGHINFAEIDSVEVAAFVLDDVEVTASSADLNATTNFEEILAAADTTTCTVNSGKNLDIAGHDGTTGLKLGGVLLTQTATTLNKVDGFLTVLDSIAYTGSTMTFYNSDGKTATLSFTTP